MALYHFYPPASWPLVVFHSLWQEKRHTVVHIVTTTAVTRHCGGQELQNHTKATTGPTPSKKESRWKMTGTELGIRVWLHLWELKVQGSVLAKESFLAKDQMCISDSVISPVENMPLPWRIKSLDTLDGSASHCVSPLK